ncbi:hypothetical protein ACFSQ7_25660 [Paenibacillus rhizoplanae]
MWASARYPRPFNFHVKPGFFAELTRKNLTQQLFEDLVAQCQEVGIIDGTHVAIDSAAIHAYEKKRTQAKKKRAHWQCQLGCKV